MAPSFETAEALAGSGTTVDALLGGRVRLHQPATGHRAGTDAVLLAGLADLRAGDHVVDLGSGSGAVGLMIAARWPDIRLTAVDRDPALVDLTRRNFALNGFEDRATAVVADAFAPAAEWRAAGAPHEAADLVVTNPPFADPGGRASPDPGRRAAHVLAGGTLADWIACGARILRPRGRLALIHRADRLDDCLAGLRPAFGSVTVTPVHPRRERDASRVVIAAVRAGRGPLRIAPPLVLHEEDGGFTPATAALHGG